MTPVVAVAASGGRDSTALLHATVHAAARCGLQVVALHVHHGLNPAAGGWQRHVQRQCARWARSGLPVRCLARRLEGAPAPGDSVEAWARRERYRALAEMAREAGAALVLLAHHRRDQAETLLLQALRGGGPAGLAAMPRETVRDGIAWCRPWLDQPGEAIAAYVARHRLGHIDDDSNADTRFDRNRLRLEVWPALLRAFPQAETSLAQAARQSRRAARLIDEIGSSDLQAVQAARVPAEAGAPGADALDLRAWLALSLARRAGALRAWLAAATGDAVRDRGLERLLAELPTAPASARWPWGARHELRLYRGRLQAAVLPAAMPAEPLSIADPLVLHEPGSVDLPAWGGRLELQAVEQGGAPVALLAQARLRGRRPGDQFQFEPRSTARSLKKQYQARAVPAWLREGPVLAVGDQVVFVPGLGLDARAWAAPGEPQLLVRWWPTGG
ncbi:MAG: tRNA lysidine(34) synthetase TilS [Burkholderiaceae bacterium]